MRLGRAATAVLLPPAGGLVLLPLVVAVLELGRMPASQPKHMTLAQEQAKSLRFGDPVGNRFCQSMSAPRVACAAVPEGAVAAAAHHGEHCVTPPLFICAFAPYHIL